ncbi:hypothetical protein D3C81_2175690 [compost metagenome]
MSLERLVALEADHRHIEDRLQSGGMNAFDDISTDSRLDRLSHHIRVMLIGKHDDRTRSVTTDQDHLLHDVTAR